jgi:ribonuclease P protein component
MAPVEQAPFNKLKRRAEFLAVAGKGRKAPSPGLVLQVLRRNDTEPARLGFTVTKKVGNAVRRNRTKRRLRAAARAVLAEQALPGVDLVLIGRDGTAGRPFEALKTDFRRLIDKLGARA